MSHRDMFLLAAKSIALVCGICVVLACAESTSMNLAADGYRQMNTPGGNAMALLMGVAASDTAQQEQREHELAVARASQPQNVVVVNGQYRPADGYDWVEQTQGDFRVRWAPGKAHPAAPHVVAGPSSASWQPAPGYRWANPSAQDDLRVVSLESVSFQGSVAQVVSGPEVFSPELTVWTGGIDKDGYPSAENSEELRSNMKPYVGQVLSRGDIVMFKWVATANVAGKNLAIQLETQDERFTWSVSTSTLPQSGKLDACYIQMWKVCEDHAKRLGTDLPDKQVYMLRFDVDGAHVTSLDRVLTVNTRESARATR